MHPPDKYTNPTSGKYALLALHQVFGRVANLRYTSPMGGITYQINSQNEKPPSDAKNKYPGDLETRGNVFAQGKLPPLVFLKRNIGLHLLLGLRSFCNTGASREISYCPFRG